MKKPSLLRTLAAWSAAAALLAGCGGGGGGEPAARYGKSSDFEGTCTVEAQKSFVRAYLDEVYLWYDEIVDVDRNRYTDPRDYFNALLVRTPTANGRPRDEFSAAVGTPQLRSSLATAAPQQVSLDGLLKAGANAVTQARVAPSPAGRPVGYIEFRNHDPGSQDELISAFRTIQSMGAQDLVLDLRDNSGGFLYVALTAASMITGPGSEGQVFEQLQYNKKRQQETDASTLRFSGKVQYAETQYPVGTELPQLGLPRVFILTTEATCSASESIINSLRGINVQVIRIGSRTCGKPYGFREKPNCGVSYFPIEFIGSNAQGFGDYTAGFQPTCAVAESTNPTVTPGSPGDPLLRSALYYVDNGRCESGATGVQSSAEPLMSRARQPDRPAWAGRLLLPQQQPR
jgi:hypothetical protein